jgi:hypothetical protein
MHTVEAAREHAATNGVGLQAGRSELGDGHDAVLASRQPGDLRVGREG